MALSGISALSGLSVIHKPSPSGPPPPIIQTGVLDFSKKENSGYLIALAYYLTNQ